LTNKKKQPFEIPTTKKQKRLLGLASLSLSISSAIYSISEEDNMCRYRPKSHFSQKSFGFGQILRYFGRSLYMGVACCYATPPMKILHEKIIAWREKEDYE